jgi:hypothetical protein
MRVILASAHLNLMDKHQGSGADSNPRAPFQVGLFVYQQAFRWGSTPRPAVLSPRYL